MDAEIQCQIDQYNDLISRGGPAHIYAKLAEAYRKANLMQEAARTARAGLQLHPDSLLIQESLGLCLLDMGETEAAVRALAPVVEKLPENGVAAIALAIALSRLNRTADAVRVLKRRLAKDPFDASARNLLAQMEGAKAEAPTAKAVAEIPREGPSPLSATESPVQTDMDFVVKPTNALFDAASAGDTDAVVDFKNIFDERPRTPPAKPAEASPPKPGGEKPLVPATPSLGAGPLPAKRTDAAPRPVAAASAPKQAEGAPGAGKEAAAESSDEIPNETDQKRTEKPEEIKPRGFFGRLWRWLTETDKSDEMKVNAGKQQATRTAKSNRDPSREKNKKGKKR